MGRVSEELNFGSLDGEDGGRIGKSVRKDYGKGKLRSWRREMAERPSEFFKGDG